MTTIVLNGESQPLAQSMSIDGFLVAYGYADKIVAVAVNKAFVPRSEYGNHMIVAGDHVEIVAPMQGG